MKTSPHWICILIGCLSLAVLSGCGTEPHGTLPSEVAAISTSTPKNSPTPEDTATPTSTPTETTIPTFTPLPFFDEAEFPTGVFTTDVIGIRSLEFHPDGHAYMVLPDVTLHLIYAVNGNLYTDLTGNGAFARQIPATYYWYFDGSNLTFQLMSEDLVWSRERDFNGQVYTLTNEPLPDRDSESELIEFPTGTFLLDGSRYYAMEFKDNGTWNAYESEGATPAASGKYVTHGYLYTEMTHNYLDARKVPVTYNWTFDGKNLTFELEGYVDFEDVIPERKALFDGQTYIKIE